jgi:two-component system phosphate regulon response regulator PhoB
MNATPVILVADDDPDILNLLCVTLERAGHATLRAADGDEALRLARDHRPAACVFDVVMPGHTGIEVLEALRRDEATAEIPVLLLTATVDERRLPDGIEPDGDRFMRKPFSPRELQARVAALLPDR